MSKSPIVIHAVDARDVPVKVIEVWAQDRYKDAREIPGDATARRKKTAARKFAELGYDKRFKLTSVVDALHIEVECKSCGNVFTREISCLKQSRSDKSKGANNIKCNNCGMTANGTRSYRSSENKRSMDESDVVAYYEKGFSATQTAKKFGMNLRRVRRIIDEAGVARDRQMALQLDDYPDDMAGDPFLDEELECKECGRVFTRYQRMIYDGTLSDQRRGRSMKYCSHKCCLKYFNKRRKSPRVRRSLIAKGDTIPLGDLIERDHGICQICHEKVDMDDFYYDGDGHFHTGSRYPTIDHIKPVSKGGKHTWKNVQLAHLSCNGGKCDKLLDEIA